MSLNVMNISITDLKQPPVTLDHLLTVELETMGEAGTRILECCRVLKKSDVTIVGEVLKGQGELYEWNHYPLGDVYDWDSHSQ